MRQIRVFRRRHRDEDLDAGEKLECLAGEGNEHSTDDLNGIGLTADVPGGDDAASDDSGEFDDRSEADIAQNHPNRTVMLVAGLMSVVVAGSLAGWLGYGMHQAHQGKRTEALYVEVAKQGALNLANISSATVQDDVKRVLDSLTDPFLTEFQQRSTAFIDFVQRAKSSSQATVREAGLESFSDGRAQVLVALSVNVSADGVPTADPSRSWRMRITVQGDAGDNLKLSNVEFVP